MRAEDSKQIDRYLRKFNLHFTRKHDGFWHFHDRKYLGELGQPLSPGMSERETAVTRSRKLLTLSKSLKLKKLFAEHLAEMAMRHVIGFRVDYRGRHPEIFIEEKIHLVRWCDRKLKKGRRKNDSLAFEYNEEFRIGKKQISGKEISRSRKDVREYRRFNRNHAKLISLMIRLARLYDEPLK